MEIRVMLPEDIAHHPNPGREALEALVIEGFSSGSLSAYEARVLLGIDNRFDFDAFVKDRNIEGGSYGMADYEQDLRNLEKFDEERRNKRSA